MIFAQGAGGFDPSFLILIGGMFAIMYFLMIRPQQQRAKRHREMLETLKRGDQVVTAGGIRGKISKVHDEAFDVEVAEGVVIQFTKASIADVPSRTTPPAAPSKGRANDKTTDKTTGRANSKANDKK